MRRIAMRAVLTVLLALGASRASADTLKVGDHLAELDVAVDAGGKAFKLKALKGKWVMVTVGASWCGPCGKELPAWDKLAPMTLVYLPSDKSAVAAMYGSDHMPTTVLADPQGVVRYIRGGFEKGDV